jgi:putative transposase
MKGKSAIHIARTYAGKKKNFTGEQFWTRGYFISTVFQASGFAGGY